jgi:hypothetical protein
LLVWSPLGRAAENPQKLSLDASSPFVRSHSRGTGGSEEDVADAVRRDTGAQFNRDVIHSANATAWLFRDDGNAACHMLCCLNRIYTAKTDSNRSDRRQSVCSCTTTPRVCSELPRDNKLAIARGARSGVMSSESKAVPHVLGNEFGGLESFRVAGNDTDPLKLCGQDR